MFVVKSVDFLVLWPQSQFDKDRHTEYMLQLRSILKVLLLFREAILQDMPRLFDWASRSGNDHLVNSLKKLHPFGTQAWQDWQTR